ncbi:mucin-2-like [Schistocerca gregaria]|uniref:mucin-2-like n=1 Tax=Schistocerca gregaria TaxID=7010 RepID=UPI00211E5A82|nr:mucin-2-like [Schistocerca gregaria]
MSLPLASTADSSKRRHSANTASIRDTTEAKPEILREEGETVMNNLLPLVSIQELAEVFPPKILKASETITAATTTTSTKAATAATSTAETPLVLAAATESIEAAPTPPKVAKTSGTATVTTTNAVTAPSTAEPAIIPEGKSIARATEPLLATAEPSTTAAESTPILIDPVRTTKKL